MSKFLVVKKQYISNNSSNKRQLLVSRQLKEIKNSTTPSFSIIKKYSEIKTSISFDSCGGPQLEDIVVAVGKTYSILPVVSKPQYIFLGWFTQESGGTQITNDSIVSINITKLYAHWEFID